MRPNKGLFIAALILVLVLGLITIWSTVPDLFFTQLEFIIAGIIIVFLLSRLDTRTFFSISTGLYITSIFLLILTAIIGRNIRGSVRWIDLGIFNLQTSEIVKPFLAIFYASYLSQSKISKWKDVLKFLLLAMIPVVLVIIQPDLGTALTLICLPLALLVFTGHIKKLLIIGAVFLAVAIPLESYFLKPYQRQRIDTFINPYKDPQGAIQATIAVGSGGIFGKGVKLGTQSHLNFLPERHTDFIFASFVEEFGLVGASFLLAAYFFIFQTCLQTGKVLRDSRASLLSLSVFTIMAFQTVVNIGMNLGVMPVTGITLPLFSYGGSSLLSFAILIGLQLRQLDLITPFEI
ncbi:MAG: Rod shape-determining protein RodA [Candidatus Collierbacteria bacterium GW2011_GWD2_42_50]|nr:MAG: Rod shape-determining protein RodA [Candidatus Collierbacteria bacterium GW2011_GWD2_42_50]